MALNPGGSRDSGIWNMLQQTGGTRKHKPTENHRPPPEACEPAAAGWAHKYIVASIVALVFLTPFPHITSIQEFCFYPAAGLFLILLFRDRSLLVNVPPLTIPFAAFTLWAAAGLTTALDLSDSLRTFWSHWLRYLLFFYMVVRYFRSPERFVLLARRSLFRRLFFPSVSWSIGTASKETR